MFIELRELLCSGAIRRHQLGEKELLTPTSFPQQQQNVPHRVSSFSFAEAPSISIFDAVQHCSSLYWQWQALQPTSMAALGTPALSVTSFPLLAIKLSQQVSSDRPASFPPTVISPLLQYSPLL